MDTDRSDHDDLTCSLCAEPFDESERLPRLFPACGHTFCSYCISQLLVTASEESPFLCPEDSIECFLTRREVGCLPKNFALIRLMEKRKSDRGSYTSRRLILDENLEKPSPEDPIKEGNLSNHLDISYQPHDAMNTNQKEEIPIEQKGSELSTSEDNICPEHGRRLEVVCIEHKARICTNCALFGSHKSHTIRPEEDVLFEITNRGESLLNMLRKIDREQEEAESEQNKSRFLSKIDDKFGELKSLTMEKFRELKDIICSKETELLNELERKKKAFEETFSELSQGPEELLDKINEFKSSASVKLASLSEGSLAFELLEDRKNPETDILLIGEKVIQEQEELRDIPRNVLDESLKYLRIDFNSNFESSLENFGVFTFKYVPEKGSGKKVHTLRQKCINNMRNQVLCLQQRHFKNSNPAIQDLKPDTQDNSMNSGYTTPLSFERGVNNNNSGTVPFVDNSVSTISKVAQGYHVRSLTHNSISSAITNNNTISQLINPESSKQDYHRGNSNIFDSNFMKQFRKPDSSDYVSNTQTKENLKKRASFKLNDADEENDLLYFEIEKLSLLDINDGLLLENKMSMDVKNTDFGDITPVLTTGQRDLSQEFELQKILSENQSKLHQNNVCASTGLPMTESVSMNEVPGFSTQSKVLKKKMNFKVPEKFEAAMDSLKKDAAEIVDFTGAELGEPGIHHISPFIEKAKTLKTLKLLKNKLNDDAIPVLLKALCSNSSIQSLNLAQNLLSEKALDQFISFFQANITIKILCLNQNSISLRNVKAKINDLKKLGVTVSV